MIALLVLTVVLTAITTDAHAESITIKFDKSEYQTGDVLNVTGQIPNVGMPIIAMSIYDPNGTILSANSVEMEPDGLFTKTIFLDSPFYDESGEYKIKFDYGQITQNEYFVISNPETPQITEETTTPEILTLTTDKPKYSDGDHITISGTVSVMDSPTVLIGIYDTFGSPAGFYFGNVNSDLSFSTTFLAVAGVNFKIDGTYSIKAHYAESSKNIPFDFSKVVEIPVNEPVEPTEDPMTIKDPVEIDIATNDSQTNDSQTNDSQTNDSQATTNETIKNDELVKSPTKENTNQNTPLIQNIPQEKSIKPNNDKSIIQKTQSSKTSIQKSVENKNEDNLSVEDVALGIMLNQINLECDHSKYADTISYYDGMGPALYRLCKFNQSLDYFNQSLLKDPENVDILVNKGSTLGKLGFYSEAIMYYDQALEISPDFIPALNNKANMLATMGNLQEAKSLYMLALEKNHNYVTAKQNLSLVTLQLENQIANTPQIQNTQNIVFEEPLSNYETSLDDKKSEKIEIKKENPNFFDELSMAFSSLGSLFGFK